MHAWPPLVAVLGLLALDNLVLRLPRMGPFASLQWNWQGKLLEVAWVLVVVAVAPRLSLRDIGVTAPLRPGWHRPALVLAGVTLALPLAFTLLGARDTLTPEGWCFEATMPGIAEELVYRGLLLELCDRALGRPWRIAGADVGWGVVITAVLFAAGHAIAVDRSGALDVEPLLAVGPLVGSRLGALAARLARAADHHPQREQPRDPAHHAVAIDLTLARSSRLHATISGARPAR
ncbi:MAG TPA: CPBP family intramembrane glutamic endopeptidase [Kofleriaceae bacterium]|nr:CPBP family intramembrane glutamic endopeptidase [Kofleriaceae bacterium]